MKYFRGKFVRATALFMAVIMLVFTPATDYLSVPSGKIESEAAALGGVAIYEVVKYVLIALAGSVGVYGLSKVEWGKLVDEYLWSINDTVLPMATFLTLMAGQKLEGISQWEGSIFYYPNGLGPSDPDDPNPPDPEKKPKISLGKKLAASWTAFLVAKNLTGDSRKPDATEAEQTEYVPESVMSNDYVVKFTNLSKNEIFDTIPTMYQSLVDSDVTPVAYSGFEITNDDIAYFYSRTKLFETYPYIYVYAPGDSYTFPYVMVSSSPVVAIGSSNVGAIRYGSSDGKAVLYESNTTKLNELFRKRPADFSMSASNYSYVSFYDDGYVFYTNDSSCSMGQPSGTPMYAFSYASKNNDNYLMYFNNDSINLTSGRWFNRNYVFSYINYTGKPNSSYVLSYSLLLSTVGKYSYSILDSYSLYADYFSAQATLNPVTAPVPGLYDPTKSTEDVKVDTEGNFSLEFDNLEESIAQLNQKVDAATEADIALDNQLKQELMDYIDSLIQGQVDPAPDPNPNPDPEPNPNPDPEPNPNPDPEPEPNPNPNPEPTPEDLDPENWKIPLDFKNKFPFSIPWDVYGCLTVLQATETPPVWEVPFVVKTDSIKIEEKVVLDLTKPEYAGMIKIVRAFFLLLYIVSLVMVTRYLIKG